MTPLIPHKLLEFVHRQFRDNFDFLKLIFLVKLLLSENFSRIVNGLTPKTDCEKENCVTRVEICDHRNKQILCAKIIDDFFGLKLSDF